jgi:hypothetical protein
VFAVMAGGAAAFLTILLLDWLLWLPPLLRLIGGSLFGLGFVGATFHWVVLPLRARISPDELAGQLERRFSQLQDQLSSTVDFLRREETASAAMVKRVVADTERMIRDLPLGRALSVRPVAVRGTVFAAGLVVLAGVLLLAPSWVRTGVVRYSHPWGLTEWPRSVEIEPLTGDQLVALGESVVVRMAVRRGLHDSLRGVVQLREADGHAQALTLQRDGNETFFTTVDSVTEDLTYWFEAGDDSTRRHPFVLRAVRRPEVVEALASVGPPSYATGRTPKVVDLTDGPAEVPLGGSVAIHLRVSKPLAPQADQTGAEPNAVLRSDGGDTLPLTIDLRDPTQATAWLEVTGDVTLRPELRDEQGFLSRGGPAYTLRALPDRPPTVTVLEPGALSELTPAGSLRLVARAEDDFGIARIDLHVEGFRDGRTSDIPLTDRMLVSQDEDSVEAALTHAWNLEPLSLSAGELLIGEVVVVDNRGGDQGQIVRSSPFRVKLISQAEFDVRAREELSVIEGRLRQAILDQAAVRDRTLRLAAGLAENDPPTSLDASERETVVRLAGSETRLTQQLRDVAGKVLDLVTRMERNHAGDDQNRERLAAGGIDLRRVAVGVMSEAAAKLGRAQEPSLPPAIQHEGLQASVVLQGEAIERLTAVLHSMSQWGAFAGLLARTRDLLDRQHDVRTQTSQLPPSMLGQPVESLTPAEAAVLKRLERQQEQIADDLDRHLSNLEQLVESTREKDPSGSAAIEDAVRVGRAHDTPKRVRAAAEAIRGNRTAGAGLDQAKAADGLRKMVAALRERDERELLQLRKELELAESQVAELLETQRSLRAATHELERLGGDEPAHAVIADEQRQLSRNTRIVGEELLEMPRALIPARQVIQAVDPMSRAESALRAVLASTAVPAQDEATQYLTGALAGLTALAEESAEEAFRRTITHIQEELAAIAAAQRSVHQGVESLVLSTKQSGRLGRLETREAGKLAREQGDVRQMTEEIMPDLEKVPVYDWAIQRVARWMETSRAHLDERRIDDQLVTTTDRIVKELDKLVNALIETQNLPATSEFAEAETQGGGQEGETADSASVPTVAELLVLKAMQRDINDRTRGLDAEFDVQSASEAQLRQLAILGEDQHEVQRLTELVTRKAQGDAP